MFYLLAEEFIKTCLERDNLIDEVTITLEREQQERQAQEKNKKQKFTPANDSILKKNKLRYFQLVHKLLEQFASMRTCKFMINHEYLMKFIALVYNFKDAKCNEIMSLLLGTLQMEFPKQLGWSLQFLAARIGPEKNLIPNYNQGLLKSVERLEVAMRQQQNKPSYDNPALANSERNILSNHQY